MRDAKRWIPGPMMRYIMSSAGASVLSSTVAAEKKVRERNVEAILPLISLSLPHSFLGPFDHF